MSVLIDEVVAMLLFEIKFPMYVCERAADLSRAVEDYIFGEMTYRGGGYLAEA